MDAEVRALARRLAADPRDTNVGLALARALARAEGSASGGVEAVPVPEALGPGALVLVVRAARPRALHAWPAGADAAIGRTGRVRAVAADRLSCEVEVEGVGRFHAGAASLHALEDARATETSPGEVLLSGAEDLGELGDDGLTEVQRALLGAAADEPHPLREIAERAGYSASNNRSLADAALALETLAPAHEPHLALVQVASPDLLGGEVASSMSSPWTDEDDWVARDFKAARILAGLPWAVVAGLRSRTLTTPPHDAREVGAALLRLLEKPDASLDDVLRVLPGPEFMTGHRGEPEAIRRLYETGEGSLTLRTSFEIELPVSVVVTVPEPGAVPTRDALEAAIEEAVGASRLEGVDTVLPGEGSIRVHAQRGQDLLALRRRLENLLPRERTVTYRLPQPLVAWLRAFLDQKRKMGVADADLRRAIQAARAHGQSAGRRPRR